ncbi:MAG: DUF4157 domain-containing protein [Accumulibacter sp.]|jgi:hypothetical protein
MSGLQRMLRQAGKESAGGASSGGRESAREQREQAGVPRFLSHPALPATLEVGPTDDPLEREADAVADAVVHDAPTLPRFLAPAAAGDRGHTAAAAAAGGKAVRPHALPGVRRKSLRADPPDDGQNAASTAQGDGAQPLLPSLRNRIEATLGADLADVRVHQGPTAADANARIGARAFTHGRDVWLGERQRPDDAALIAHEAAHVVQQRRGDVAIRRQADAAAGSGSEPAAAGTAGQSFAFSEDEMASRLAATPAAGADAAATSVELNPGTRSTLGEVAGEAERGDGEPAPEEAATAETADDGGGDGDAGGAGGEDGSDAGQDDAALRAGGPIADAGSPPPVERPGPAAEFESLVGEEVAAYLEGNLSEERIAALDPQTRALLDAADALGERRLTDPEASALQGLAGEGLQPGAPRTGYEAEPLWLRTLATIRDVTGQLGGIVGIIGLVATVSGFILSLLLPPVGAFLLTVGRFCDVAALILDGISLVLGIILTGYNYYRLKNETDPEERRRLLGMVRQDAMGTVMSAVAVATAVAPGAARLLGRSRVGRLVGGAARGVGRRVAGAAGRLAAQPGRIGRAAAAVGRAGSGAAGAVRRSGAGASGRFHTFMGRTRDFGLRSALSTTAAGRAARAIGRTGPGRVAGGALAAVGTRARALLGSAPGRLLGGAAAAGASGLRRFGRGVAGSAAGRWLAGSRLGRYAGRVYGENLDLARLLFARSERAHHGFVGARLRAELAGAQSAGALTEAAARARLQARMPASEFPEINFNDLALRADPAAGGRLVFGRPGNRLQRFLDGLRRNEATTINNAIAANPSLSDADLARQLNARPNAPAQWTEAEVAAFRQQATRSAVYKTPHHTISVLDAPHVAYDPRYIQLGNAPLVVPPGTTRATSPWALFGTRSARRPPGGSGAPLDVPFIRTTGEAEALARGGPAFATGGPSPTPLTGSFDPDYFRSEAFFEALRREGNTGIWVNPNDPSQRLLFDAHFVAGHRWQTGEAGARALFGPTVDFADRFAGVVPRTLLDRSIAGIGRIAVRGSDDVQMQSLALGDWMLAQLGVPSAPGDEAAAGSATELAAASATESAAASAAESAAATATRNAGETTSAGPEDEPPAVDDTLVAGSGDGGAAALGEVATAAAQPPTPVPWSPSALVSIREQRIDISSAMEVVNDCVSETVVAEQHNVAARAAAATLQERNTAQARFAGAERATVAAEQGKLDQATTAQQEMSAQGAEASGDAARGQQEADAVQSEGQGVSVEAKPEEPRSRSWLERAWDATAGALWDGLVAPAVRAVRRKVNQVMQSINEFIMGMINQALGLDEIEAELDGGGQDIAARSGSLEESDAGLEAVGEQAGEEQQRNRQSMDQADANIDDARAARADALALQGDLAAHDGVLAAEEMAGESYVVDFAATYRPYFAATGGGTVPARADEGATSEAASAAAGAESESDEAALVS